MDFLARSDLQALVNQTRTPCVSILMPTHRGADSRQNLIRLRNLLDKAKDQLAARGMRNPDAADLLQPAVRLLEDSDFWRRQSDGVAIYVAPDFFRQYRLPLQLPEQVAINSHFLVRPLLPLFTENGLFYVLSVSQHAVRLLQCTRHTEREISLEGMGVPAGIDDLMKFSEREKQTQFHARTPQVAAAAGGRRAAMFFGAAGYDMSVHKADVQQYLLQLDRGLHNLLRNEQAPLVFAGVDYLFGMYQQVNTYRYLTDRHVEGSPDRESDDAIREKAWETVQPYFDRTREQAVGLYNRAVSSGLASENLQDIVPAARNGRVHVLFSRNATPVWGVFKPDTFSVAVHQVRHEEDDDLIDYATVQTLLHGGTAFSDANGAGESALAAVFRY
jgi:hypothetical protein